MERHELRELVEDALEALKTRYQRTRTPFNLQTIREEVEDQHGAPLADDDAAQIPGIMQRLWERRWGVEPSRSAQTAPLSVPGRHHQPSKTRASGRRFTPTGCWRVARRPARPSRAAVVCQFGVRRGGG
jgi:hypothetical protein